MIRSGAVPGPAQPTLNHQFTSPDGVWRVNLTGKFISLACKTAVGMKRLVAEFTK